LISISEIKVKFFKHKIIICFRLLSAEKRAMRIFFRPTTLVVFMGAGGIHYNLL
jgi:hypothetical protein